MEAKDTVMHLDDIDNGRMPDSYSSLRTALEKQAEISFKAGIKEVVGCIHEHWDMSDEAWWQAKLKEWGISP